MGIHVGVNGCLHIFSKGIDIADPDNLLFGIGLIIGQRTDRVSMRQNTPAVTRQTA